MQIAARAFNHQFVLIMEDFFAAPLPWRSIAAPDLSMRIMCI